MNIAASGEMAVSEQLLAQLVDRLGQVMADVGSIKARLDHGQKNFDTLRQETVTIRRMLEPVVSKVTGWEPHIEAAKQTTIQFDGMQPEFRKMRVVTARFMAVAMVQGTVVSAALWGLWMVWPVVWGWIKTHVSISG